MNQAPNQQQRYAGHLAATHIAEPLEVSGVLHVIRAPTELLKFREGEILVAQTVWPSWSEMLEMARAVICASEEINPRVLALANRCSIPVLRIKQAQWKALRSGDIVQIRTDGLIEPREERREPDSPMRISVPAARTSRLVMQRDNQGDLLSGQDVTVLPGADAGSKIDKSPRQPPDTDDPSVPGQ